MSKPENAIRRVFKSSNGFNPATRWNTSEGKVMAVRVSSRKKQGYCFAMTCHWLRLARQHGIEQSSQVLDGRALLHISIVQSFYLRSAGTVEDEVRENLVYDQLGLKYTKRFTAKDLVDTKINLQVGYYEVGLPEHSVGLFVDGRAKRVWYFDPNYGLFEYNALEFIRRHWFNTYGADWSTVVYSTMQLK